MAEPQPIQTPAVKPDQTLKPLQMVVSGKVESHRIYEKKHYTVLVCPSGDEFVAPSAIDVESVGKLSEVGDTWRGLCFLRGSRHSYDFKDKKTGETGTVKTARHYVVAVE